MFSFSLVFSHFHFLFFHLCFFPPPPQAFVCPRCPDCRVSWETQFWKRPSSGGTWGILGQSRGAWHPVVGTGPEETELFQVQWGVSNFEGCLPGIFRGKGAPKPVSILGVPPQKTRPVGHDPQTDGFPPQSGFRFISQRVPKISYPMRFHVAIVWRMPCRLQVRETRQRFLAESGLLPIFTPGRLKLEPLGHFWDKRFLFITWFQKNLS